MKCFSDRNVSPKWTQGFVKIFLQCPAFCQKAQNFGHMILFILTSSRYKQFLRNVWRDFINVGISKGSTESVLTASFIVKIDFQFFFNVTIANANRLWKSKYLHILVDRYFVHLLVKCEQNHIMVWSIQNLELFDQKWLTILGKVLTSFWKTFLWLKQLLDAKLLIQSFSSFSIPKITVVRQV